MINVPVAVHWYVWIVFLGRSDDMLIIRGVNVFPTQIESVILEMEEFEPHYLLIVGRENNTDTMELQVEVRPEFYSDEINKMLALKKKLGGRLQSVLGLGVNVKLVEPRSIERSVGKAKRVIDNRKIYYLKVYDNGSKTTFYFFGK